MTTLLFDPAKLPPRDADGYTWHPDLDERFEDPELGEEYISRDKFREHGLEFRVHEFEHDYTSQEMHDRYYQDGESVPDWQPTPPEGDGWRLAAIYDTEDGPVALFVRDIAEVRA
jgi:hypothetical protein